MVTRPPGGGRLTGYHATRGGNVRLLIRRAPASLSRLRCHGPGITTVCAGGPGPASHGRRSVLLRPQPPALVGEGVRDNPYAPYAPDLARTGQGHACGVLPHPRPVQHFSQLAQRPGHRADGSACHHHREDGAGNGDDEQRGPRDHAQELRLGPDPVALLQELCRGALLGCSELLERPARAAGGRDAGDVTRNDGCGVELQPLPGGLPGHGGVDVEPGRPTQLLRRRDTEVPSASAAFTFVEPFACHGARHGSPIRQPLCKTSQPPPDGQLPIADVLRVTGDEDRQQVPPA